MQEMRPPSQPPLPPTSAPTSTLPGEANGSHNANTNAANGIPEVLTAHRLGSSLLSQRPELRIDPFLGEWLSPDYFDEAQAPPASSELVSEARKFLHTPAEEIIGADLAAPHLPEFAGVDWSSRETERSSTPLHEKTGLRAISAAGNAIPKRSRTSFGAGTLSATDQRSPQFLLPYSPPIPTYSIAPRDPIPIGFCAHARDACILINETWDSSKPPHEWGDGGAFHEEWSAMHRRFRNGLQNLLAFYEDSEDDAEEEFMVILVTHQAGCNALIRQLTGAPALHDIGTASLTLAVRREDVALGTQSKSSFPNARRGSLDQGIAASFEMKIIASTEHLRGGSNPLGLNSPRLGISPAIASRRAVGADSPEGFSIGAPMTRSYSGYGTLGQSASQRARAADDRPTIQTGLWRRESIKAEAEEPNATSSSSSTQLWGADSEDRLAPPSLPMRSASQRGMWGGESSVPRARSPGKRRWTAVDRSP